MSRYRQTMSDLLEQVRNPKQEAADYLKKFAKKGKKK